MKTVFVNGCFDLLHPGHLHFLMAAKYLGDRLIVGVNTDESMLRIKGKPHRPQGVRALMLEALRVVHGTRLIRENTAIQTIEALRPDIYCAGAEYIGKSPEAKRCIELGITVVYVERLGDYSTTNEAKRV